MKKLFAMLMAISMMLALCACGTKDAGPSNFGSWQLTDDGAITDDAKTALEKATDGLLGASYSPVALLGTQLVSGTNYCFLCEKTVVYPDAKPSYAIVSVYADLQGEAEILNIVAIDLGATEESGTVVSADSADTASALGAWTIDRESTVDVDGAVLHLGSKLVSGTMHCVLCKGWSLAFVYQDLDGNVEVQKTVPLDIAALARPEE